MPTFDDIKQFLAENDFEEVFEAFDKKALKLQSKR